MKSFASMSVLTELTIKIIGMKGKDETATTIANKHLQTDTQSGYYSKCKVARVDIIKVINARDQARNYRQTMTRPYGENDLRILPTARLIEYDQKMGEYRIKFEDAVADVIYSWNSIVDRQKMRLNKGGGNMFNPADYPPQHEVEKWFVFKIGQLPVPQVDHFVLDLSEQAVEKIKRDLERSNKEKMDASYLDMFKRLYAPVSKMADICGNDKKVFDSLIGNLDTTLDILKDLNITNDVKFMQMIQEIKNHLTGYTAGQIRSDKHLKQQLGETAEELKAKMTSMMGDLKT